MKHPSTDSLCQPAGAAAGKGKLGCRRRPSLGGLGLHLPPCGVRRPNMMSGHIAGDQQMFAELMFKNKDKFTDK